MKITLIYENCKDRPDLQEGFGFACLVYAVQKQLPGKIYAVLGGFHLMESKEEKIEKIVDTFQKLHVERVAPCHCVGERAFSAFKKAYGESCLKVGTGTMVTFS